ncbi:hypothetical protein RI129_012749 [Pyrocoelia pectoralis]|uniref:CRAL-TRIO domain-containing protein n=1 Tax=Pyrocoelia pectoralis TaxID=417401 RepID=A0AAN7V148_9COLE
MLKVRYGFKVNTVVDEGRITVNQINDIKAWLKNENLNLTDDQIVLFSLSCLNRIEDVKLVIKSYYTTKTMCPAIFTNRKVHLAKLQQQLKVVQLAVFPERTVDGCVIIFHRLCDTNFRHYHMESAMKLLFMTLDAAIYDYPPTGLIILFDMQGVGLLHLTRVELGLVKIFFQYLQECLPVRLRNIHVLNTVYFLEKIMSFIKPFMNAEVTKLIHFHPTNLDMNEFYDNHIAREYLPANYGGYLETVDVFVERNAKRLLELEEFFEAEENQQNLMV